MMITDRDNEIIRDYFEIFKYGTIAQIEKIYFKDQDYSYNICRRRLKEMVNHEYLKVFKDTETNKNIYINNEPKIKIPSLHRMLILDVYAQLKLEGYNVEKFEIEKHWCENKYISDAFVQFTVDNLGEGKGRRYRFFVEVQISNNYHNLNKYDELYETKCVQEYLGADIYPRILLISDRTYSNIKLEHTSVIQLDTKLHSFSSILL